MNRVLCIYHGNCADGFGAAWAVRHALGDGVEFHPGIYQADPPDVAGRDVVIVDFSYKRPVLEQMAHRARSLLVLDHHKSAAEDLEGLPPPIFPHGWKSHLGDVVGAIGGVDPNLPRVQFDMDRSGAMMAWDFFNQGKQPPRLLEHIQDRDLWRFALEGTREIQANVFSHPYDFDIWDALMAQDVAELRKEGEAIERKHHKDVAELVNVTKRVMTIGGYRVPVANLPYTLTSDAGHLMCDPASEALPDEDIPPFAACYWDTSEGRVFSLRSADQWGGVDVSQVAVKYGGGGHKNAAGFRMPIGWEGE